MMAARRMARGPVDPTTFGHEQPDGTFDLHFYPPAKTVRGESAEGLVARRKAGQRVVVYMLHPPGMVCDLVITGTRVHWLSRPNGGKPPSGWPITSSASPASG